MTPHKARHLWWEPIPHPQPRPARQCLHSLSHPRPKTSLRQNPQSRLGEGGGEGIELVSLPKSFNAMESPSAQRELLEHRVESRPWSHGHCLHTSHLRRACPHRRHDRRAHNRTRRLANDRARVAASPEKRCQEDFPSIRVGFDSTSRPPRVIIGQKGVRMIFQASARAPTPRPVRRALQSPRPMTIHTTQIDMHTRKETPPPVHSESEADPGNPPPSSLKTHPDTFSSSFLP